MTVPARRLSRGRSRLFVALTAATLIAAVGGCGDDGSGDGSGDGDTIAVTLITKNSTNPFFVAMQEGAKESAEKEGVNLTIAAGKAGRRRGRPDQAIENAIARGDKGILITPNGPGVNPAIKQARDAGLYVIALDTPPDPADTVDITFATDNFKAGKLIGQWAAAHWAASRPRSRMLDLFNDKIVSVDYNRDQGFLTGMGIDVEDKKRTATRRRPAPTPAAARTRIVCNEPTNGRRGRRPYRDGALPDQEPERSMSSTRSTSRPRTVRTKALKAAGQATTCSIVSIDGGCDGVEAGQGRASSTPPRSSTR